MPITNDKTFPVEGIKYNWTLLKIQIHQGLHGWGEATNWPGSPLVEATCAVALGISRFPFISDQHGDIALWNLKDKSLGVPIYELLGSI